ncbi:hypothetical protein D3C84_1180070 [compost metagenome]
MFLWNMLGALIGVPALSCFLLCGSEATKAPTRQEGDAREGAKPCRTPVVTDVS